jgi:hypothetical protein
MQITIAAFTLICLVISSPALAEMSDKQKVEYIMRLAQPTQEEQVFYRWQPKTSGDELIKSGHFSNNLFTRFMNKTHGVNAGPGLYISESMHSSATFGGENANLIEVHIAKDTPTLNLTDLDTERKLRANGISIDDVIRLNPPVVINYISDWHVVKHTQGVTFKPFDPQKYSFDRLHKEYRDILEEPSGSAKDFFIKEVKKKCTDSLILDALKGMDKK